MVLIAAVMDKLLIWKTWTGDIYTILMIKTHTLAPSPVVRESLFFIQQSNAVIKLIPSDEGKTVQSTRNSIEKQTLS